MIEINNININSWKNQILIIRPIYKIIINIIDWSMSLTTFQSVSIIQLKKLTY